MTSKSQTLEQAIQETLREAASYTLGDQIRPCAVLWLDPDKNWDGIIPDLQNSLKELYVLGSYLPSQRRGPALWLRCVEARAVGEAPQEEMTPVFYLPGVGRELLKDLETVPGDLAPLADLQCRGVLWLHPNGKEWTPFAYLSSSHGGLALTIDGDQSTKEALIRALPKLIKEQVGGLASRVLTADFFNELIAPDAIGQILRWLDDVDGFRNRQSESEWKAFSQQCKVDFHFEVEKDGPLKAAELLAKGQGPWRSVWNRFTEAPENHKGVVDWLRRAEPKRPTLYDSSEVWPSMNDREEVELGKSMDALVGKPQDQIIRAIIKLDQQHGPRRGYPWARLGMSVLAMILEPLAQLARCCEKTPGGPTAEVVADYYAAEGWKTDAAALKVLAACNSGLHESLLAVVRAVYLLWLDGSARHLQKLLLQQSDAPPRKMDAPKSEPGKAVVFVDGLRLDVAQMLKECMNDAGMDASLEWDWAPLPTVTATAKPHCSPIVGSLKSGDLSGEFSPNLQNGQRLTHDRFLQLLRNEGWQVLSPNEKGDPTGSAWTEAGALDERGHSEGWKLAKRVTDEVREITIRIAGLLKAGWSKVELVTDHGWLLVPGGMEKQELKAFLAEHRWGRCAAVKTGINTGFPEYKWFWNSSVVIVVPHGAGSFIDGREYSHGGVSLQEMVVPRLTVTLGTKTGSTPLISDFHWTGARCKIIFTGNTTGTVVDIRNDSGNSLLEEKKPVGNDRTATVYLKDDADLGKHAFIILIDSSDKIIQSLSVQLGENS